MPDKSAIFCGNFEYDAQERDVVRLFEKYGTVERIDMKTGFAFVYMRHREDAQDAIKDLDGREWGYKRRPLRVEFAQKTEDTGAKNLAPNKTLFVVNFDTLRTRERDIEDCFHRFGRLKRVQIKRNYSFVEFDELDDAVTAQKKMHGSTFMGRTLTVEFVANNKSVDWGDRPRDRSPPPVRRRSPSPYGGGGDRRRRSPTPERRRRPSPPERRSYSPEGDRRRRSPPARRSRSRSPVADSPNRMDEDGRKERRRSPTP